MDPDRIEGVLSQIIEAVRAIAEKQCAMDEELDKLLSSKVYDRLDAVESEFGSMVGGLNDIIDGRRKREYTEGLREKHPEFGRYEDIGKRFGLDVYGIAADNTFGMADEEREGAIGQMLEELKSKFDDLISALETHNAHESAESPAEEKAEHEGGEEAVGEKKPGAMGIEIEVGHEPKPDVIEAARRFRGARAG